MVIDYMDEMNKKRYEEYMEALQEERRKIQVFHRELPLCLDLVNQAIENCKQLTCERFEREEEQISSEVPILEEFIPLKKSSSFSQEEQSNKSNEEIGKKVDWLRSVQLWNQNSDDSSFKEDTNQEDGSKENGITFQKPNKLETAIVKAKTGTNITMNMPCLVPIAASSSTGDNSDKRKEEKDGQLNRKARRCWSPELHRRFLQALQQLGGSHAATPKQIRELMKVDGLTNDEVKSHLQKYRLHTRRPGPSIHNNGNTQQAQFVVVGGIWVPPQDYAAASTAATTNGEATPGVPGKIYAPVAAPPQLTMSSRQKQQQHQQQQRKQLHLSPTGSSHSDRRSSRVDHSMGDENAHSGSPAATSSSTDTTTASPAF